MLIAINTGKEREVDVLNQEYKVYRIIWFSIEYILT